MTAPAPLAAAIEEARHWLSRFDAAVPTIRPGSLDPSEVRILRRLLLALDADDRLAKAEKVLKEISAYCCQYETMGYDRDCAALFEPGTVTCYSCRSRRYFAEKGDDHG